MSKEAHVPTIRLMPGNVPYHSNFLVFVITFHAVFLISPIVYFSGFRASLVIPATLAAVLMIVAIRDRPVPRWAILLALASIATACGTGVYWESWRAGFLPAYFVTSILTVAVAADSEIRSVVNVSSALLLAMLIGGWLAVALAMSGFPPLGATSGVNDRVLHIYYTTLTPTVIGDFIRPAGIYDEPGALSLVVSVVAFLRNTLGMDRRYTWVLLILGFVTFSLAHLVYVVFHFLAEKRVLATWVKGAGALVVLVVVLSTLGLWGTFDARLLTRLSVSTDSDRVVAGDNRSQNFYTALNKVGEGEPKVLLFGVDVACIEGSPACTQRHPDLGFNPVSPLVYFGMLIAWPYYFFLAVAIGLGALRRKWWTLLAVGLLFMQRPNLFSAGYSMLAALTLVSVGRWYPTNRALAFSVGNALLARWRSAVAVREQV